MSMMEEDIKNIQWFSLTFPMSEEGFIENLNHFLSQIKIIKKRKGFEKFEKPLMVDPYIGFEATHDKIPFQVSFFHGMISLSLRWREKINADLFPFKDLKSYEKSAKNWNYCDSKFFKNGEN